MPRNAHHYGLLGPALCVVQFLPRSRITSRNACKGRWYGQPFSDHSSIAGSRPTVAAWRRNMDSRADNDIRTCLNAWKRSSSLIRVVWVSENTGTSTISFWGRLSTDSTPYLIRIKGSADDGSENVASISLDDQNVESISRGSAMALEIKFRSGAWLRLIPASTSQQSSS